MKRLFPREPFLLFIVLIVFQVLFAFYSPRYTQPSFESRIFATIGFEYTDGDLHKLNEAAHYFGQTIIGWTKFPHFLTELRRDLAFPDPLVFYAHMQERQNIVFVFKTNTPIPEESLREVHYFLQSTIDTYNQMTRTRFLLSNLDFETKEVTKKYSTGAFITLLASVILVMGFIFMKREFTWLAR